MQISTKGRYGLRALCLLALNYNKASFSVAEISKAEKIDREYLEQIFNKLKKAKVIKAFRGPKGGYVLARSPKKINIAQIMSAVGEKLELTDCFNKSCQSKSCLTKNFWKNFDKKVMENFKKTTLADLIKG